MIDLHYETLMDVGEAIRTRGVSPIELTRSILTRISQLDPMVHAYARTTPELALAQAAKAEAEIMAGNYRGPLHGIPLAVKDVCDTAGVVTAAGMAVHADRRPAVDATVVRRLSEAGAVLLGKLQLTEGAFAKYHPSIAAPQNPWNAEFYAGVSSSGSGVATAAGLAFATLASDTGGSIRFPAAANGVTGMKPSWGRVSRYGVFPLAPSLDHVGTITRSAADAAAVLNVIAGPDPHDPTTLAAPVPNYLFGIDEGIRGVRIGIDRTYNETEVDPEVIHALRDVSDILATLGAKLIDVAVPDYRAVTSNWASLAGVEAALAHAATYPSRASDYGAAASGTIAGLIEHGRAVAAETVMRMHYDRLAFSGALAALFKDIDLLLVPTQPMADFTIESERSLLERPEELTASMRFAAPFNMSGSPVLVLPGGFTAKGLPLSFQLVARPLDEGLLLQAGNAYQQATDWHRRRPPV